MPSPSSHESESLSDAEIKTLIEKQLPAWLRASETTDTDSIVLHEAAFGTSPHELLLFAAAIKYAAGKGKHVHVVSGTGRVTERPEAVLPHPTVHSVFREKALKNRQKRSAKPKKAA